MANAHSRRTDLAYIAETVFGTTPTTPAFIALNVEPGTTFTKDQTWFPDTTIRSDRNLIDTFAGNYVVRGTFSQALRPVEMDTFFESLMWGTWTTNVLKNGSTRKSVAVERAWQDIPLYQVFNGCVVDTLKLDIANNSTVKASWGIIGMTTGVPTGTTADAASGYTAQSTATPFVEGSAVITEGGSALAYATNLSIDISNNTEALNVLGTSTTYDLVAGTFKVSGSLKALFPSAALLTKFVNNTSSSLQVVLTSGANSYTIVLPNVRFVKADVPSTDGTIEQSLDFEAFYGSSDAATIKITRV